MSEAVTPEFDRFEQPTLPGQPDLRAVTYTEAAVSQFSIDDLRHNVLDPISWQVNTALMDNKKQFTGYKILGEVNKPNRETLLRGTRNVLATFDEYHDIDQVSSSTLESQAHRFLIGRRSVGEDKQTILELTNGGYRQVFGLFLELADERDPLAYALAQIYQRYGITGDDFHNLCLDSMICFQRDRFKALVDAEVIRLRQLAKKATKASR